MITADIYEIAALFIAVAILVLAVTAVPALLQLKRTAKAAENLTTEARKTLESLNGVLKKTGEQAGDIEETIKRLKEVALKVASLAEAFVESIRNPLITVLSLFLGFEFGLRRLFKKKEKGGGEDVKQG